MKKLPAVFYRTANGAEPVRDWLKALSQAERHIIGYDVGRAEPLCRSLGGGLWKIRSDLPRGRIARVIFFVLDGQMVLLHGFEKKTQQTPQAQLDLARKRRKETEG